MRDRDDTLRSSGMARKAVADVIAMQRRIFERQRSAIERNELHQTPGFARYRDEYLSAVSGYMEESGFGALCDAIASSRVTYVADYHTLRLSQKTFVKLIEGAAHQVDNFCLALELVHWRHQDGLDAFLEGSIDEETFLERIRYRERWPYDIWPSFRPIMDLARDRGFPAIAVDTDPGLPLPERDRIAAALVADAAVEWPYATIVAQVGQMHVAPSHLPAAVDLAFIKKGLSAPERTIVYQNAEEIYWQLAREGRDEVEVVRVGPDEYCVNNTPPLVQQLSYLHWVRYDEELLEYTELEGTVRALIRDLADLLDLEVGDAADRARVLMPGDLDLLDVLEERGLSKVDREQIVRQAEASESVCIPAIETIYLATLSVNHAAEEAAHYLKYAAAGDGRPEEARDRFYHLVINEACGFFGSKVINPKRKADHQGKLRSIVAGARARGGWDRDERAARFALDHLSWERSERTRMIASGADLADPDVYGAAAHMMGYILGERLYYGLTDGLVSKRRVRDLFARPLDGELEAFEVYLDLSERLREVRIPARI